MQQRLGPPLDSGNVPYTPTPGELDAENVQDAIDELYDLQTDPFELNNLIGTEEGKRLLPPLEAELGRLQRETGYRADFRGFR